MKEIKSIVIRDKNDNDIIYVGKEEVINKTGMKIIATFEDGSYKYLMDGKRNDDV